MISLTFLSSVWKQSCEDGDIVFLSTKDDSGWKDHSFVYGKNLRREIREWFSRHSSKQYDIYFCPLPFTGKKRRKDLVKNISLLWSDIDDGNPKIKPTILWESSPGRLQGLWFLDKTMNPDDGAELNKALTYYMDADKGGWDLSQVLRVPGTYNHKYDSLPKVRIIDQDITKTYSPRRLSKRLGIKDQPEPELGANADQILSKYRRQIPSKVKRLLAQKTINASADRSEMIWFLENKLSESGLSPPEIMLIIKHSVWNKYRGRSDEDERLKSEMCKIVESHIDQPKAEVVKRAVDEQITGELVIESYGDVLSSVDSSPGWLVEGFWMNQSHGIVAGEPKSFKSTLALDMAISVASGKPFMGKYEVVNPGPVVYIQNENAKWIMKDRIAKMAASKGLIGDVRKKGKNYEIDWAPEIPLYMINQQSFLLTDPVHQKLLEKIFVEYKPSLIILDPFYLMFDGDVNSATDLSPILSWLLEMRYKYRCGIMIIHHYNKGGSGSTARGGQRMLGSTTLHGWIESAWYMTSSTNDQFDEDDDIDTQGSSAEVSMDREFRGAGLYPKIDLEIEMGEVGTFKYSVTAGPHRPQVDDKTAKQNRRKSPDDVKGQVLDKLRELKETSQTDLMKRCGFSVQQVRAAIDQLTAEGSAKRKRNKIVYIA